LNGLEAIAAHNGWAIAALGVSIVFSGLIMLSLILSQLYKVLNFWDERGTYFQRIWQKESQAELPVPDMHLSKDIKDVVRQFKLLTERIGEPFPLPNLLELAEKCSLLRPHSTINYLVQAKYIIPDGTGYFYWKKKV
jgi:hypothetical protein